MRDRFQPGDLEAFPARLAPSVGVGVYAGQRGVDLVDRLAGLSGQDVHEFRIGGWDGVCLVVVDEGSCPLELGPSLVEEQPA